MGADIHTMLEKEIDGEWVLVHVPNWDVPAERRNYARFAKLARVRGDGPAPKGAPLDISKGVQYCLSKWGDRFYDDTWKYSDFCEHYLGMGFGKDECVDDFRVVYWFDN